MAPSSVPDSDRRPSVPGVGLYRGAVSIFLAALVLFILGMPFGQYLSDPGLVEGPLLSVVLVAGAIAVGGRRRTLLLAASLALSALVARWLWHYWPEPVFHGLYLVLGTLLFLQVTIQLLRFIVKAPRVDSEVLAAGVATYLVLGMLWAMLYLIVGFLEPNAFTLPASKTIDGFDALYFSLVTLTTVGYGAIVPLSPFARMLAAGEATVGTLYVAVLIARLVTLYTDQRP